MENSYSRDLSSGNWREEEKVLKFDRELLGDKEKLGSLRKISNPSITEEGII